MILVIKSTKLLIKTKFFKQSNQININFENPSDPARIPSELPNELELLEAALELNRQKRDQFFVDYESTVGELEGQITTLQEKLKTIKNSLSDRFKVEFKEILILETFSRK